MSKYNLTSRRKGDSRTPRPHHAHHQQQDTLSQKSNDSNRSARSMLLMRSNINLIQSRLKNNGSSTSRVKSTTSQCNRTKQEDQSKGRFNNSKCNEERSKSSGYTQSSKLESLSLFTQKLRSLKHKQQNAVREHKETKFATKKEQKNIRKKLSKLQKLLNNVKKSNHESSQIINTEKKEHCNYEECSNYSAYAGEPQKKLQIQDLACQLKMVRNELKDVRLTNNELLSISRSRNNADNRSFISRSDLSSQYLRSEQSCLIFNPASEEGDHWETGSQLPNFTKKQKKSYVAVTDENAMQPCFICGCTCKGRKKY